MLIRSQNKNAIYIFSTIQTIWMGNDGCGGAVKVKIETSNGCADTIGEYSTFAKGRKVLDMIANTYTDTLWTDTNMIIANRVIFEMPQDDEVEV